MPYGKAVEGVPVSETKGDFPDKAPLEGVFPKSVKVDPIRKQLELLWKKLQKQKRNSELLLESH